MLNKADGSAPYLSLIARIESLRNDRRYAFMFASLAVRDNMRQILAQLLRIPVDGKPITIIDISGVPSEIVDVVVSVLFRLVFELAVWSDRGAAPPVLLVCEEAHRYVPQEDAAGFAPTKRVISRIAKEGRKYGVTLCLVSQRPSELSIEQPVAVQHGVRAAPDQRARPGVRRARPARERALAGRQPAVAEHPGGGGGRRRRHRAGAHPLQGPRARATGRRAPTRRSPTAWRDEADPDVPRARDRPLAPPDPLSGSPTGPAASKRLRPWARRCSRRRARS